MTHKLLPLPLRPFVTHQRHRHCGCWWIVAVLLLLMLTCGDGRCSSRGRMMRGTRNIVGPYSVYADASGFILVSDTAGIWTLASESATTATLIVSTAGTADAQGTSAGVNSVYSIVANPAGGWYFGDINGVRQLATDYTVTTLDSRPSYAVIAIGSYMFFSSFAAIDEILANGLPTPVPPTPVPPTPVPPTPVPPTPIPPTPTPPKPQGGPGHKAATPAPQPTTLTMTLAGDFSTVVGNAQRTQALNNTLAIDFGNKYDANASVTDMRNGSLIVDVGLMPRSGTLNITTTSLLATFEEH